MTPEEQADVVAYVQAEMNEAEQLAFELRLKDDAELADALGRYMDIDELFWRNRAKLRRRGSRFGWRILAAAAALAAVLFTMFGLGGTSAEPETLIAVLPSYRELDAYSDTSSNPRLEGKRPPLVADLQRGIEDGTNRQYNIDAEEYFGAARPHETALRDSALTQRQASTEAEFFVVCVQTNEPRSVLVVGITDEAKPLWHLPSPLGPRERAFTATRLEAGFHELPQRLELRHDESGKALIAYEPGFTVPLGSGEHTALVGLGSSPITPALVADVNQLLAGSTGTTRAGATAVLRRFLESEGFDVFELTVSPARKENEQ